MVRSFGQTIKPSLIQIPTLPIREVHAGELTFAFVRKPAIPGWVVEIVRPVLGGTTAAPVTHDTGDP